jgi:hypothetical protein
LLEKPEFNEKKIIAAKTSIYWKKKLLLENNQHLLEKIIYCWEKPAFTRILKIIDRKTSIY